jgi:hypothetical protein
MTFEDWYKFYVGDDHDLGQYKTALRLAWEAGAKDAVRQIDDLNARMNRRAQPSTSIFIERM